MYQLKRLFLPLSCYLFYININLDLNKLHINTNTNILYINNVIRYFEFDKNTQKSLQLILFAPTCSYQIAYKYIDAERI